MSEVARGFLAGVLVVLPFLIGTRYAAYKWSQIAKRWEKMHGEVLDALKQSNRDRDAFANQVQELCELLEKRHRMEDREAREAIAKAQGTPTAP